MTKTPRGRYSQELRQQAVTMAVEDGFGVTETARRLSVPMKTLANWVTQYRLDKHEFALKPGQRAGELRAAFGATGEKAGSDPNLAAKGFVGDNLAAAFRKSELSYRAKIVRAFGERNIRSGWNLRSMAVGLQCEQRTGRGQEQHQRRQ